jgi:hypothetical protein
LRFERNNLSSGDETRAFAAELSAGSSKRRSTATSSVARMALSNPVLSEAAQITFPHNCTVSAAILLGPRHEIGQASNVEDDEEKEFHRSETTFVLKVFGGLLVFAAVAAWIVNSI